jgi:hypothetical protein
MAGTIMTTDKSGLFSFNEFKFRGSVLKLAPDAFITINGAIGSRVLSPADTNGKKDLDVKGGITSITVNAAVAPAGATRATIEVIAPLFKGMHEDYYINLPNGTKVPFFMPMMEVKIYMKGRFLESEYQNAPRYYPVFWGMITNVTESYTGGPGVLYPQDHRVLLPFLFSRIWIPGRLSTRFFLIHFLLQGQTNLQVHLTSCFLHLIKMAYLFFQTKRLCGLHLGLVLWM